MIVRSGGVLQFDFRKCYFDTRDAQMACRKANSIRNSEYFPFTAGEKTATSDRPNTSFGGASQHPNWNLKDGKPGDN